MEIIFLDSLFVLIEFREARNYWSDRRNRVAFLADVAKMWGISEHDASEWAKVTQDDIFKAGVRKKRSESLNPAKLIGEFLKFREEEPFLRWDRTGKSSTTRTQTWIFNGRKVSLGFDVRLKLFYLISVFSEFVCSVSSICLPNVSLRFQRVSVTFYVDSMSMR